MKTMYMDILEGENELKTQKERKKTEKGKNIVKMVKPHRERWKTHIVYITLNLEIKEIGNIAFLIPKKDIKYSKTKLKIIRLNMNCCIFFHLFLILKTFF